MEFSFDTLFTLRHGSLLRAMTISLSQAGGHHYRPLSREETGGGPSFSSCGKRGRGKEEGEENKEREGGGRRKREGRRKKKKKNSR